MSHRVIGAVCCALLLAACGVSKDEFAAAQRDAANNQKKYEDEVQKNAALQKKVTDLQSPERGADAVHHRGSRRRASSTRSWPAR